jgi:uncharacterized lipoprotein YehR (DUF1307 family)
MGIKKLGQAGDFEITDTKEGNPFTFIQMGKGLFVFQSFVKKLVTISPTTNGRMKCERGMYMKHFKKIFYFCSLALLVGMFLTACGQKEVTQADIDEKIWADSLKAYEITSDYVLNEDFELTDEEEKYLADYLKMSNEILLGDSDEYSETDQDLVNELVSIIHTVNIHKETQNYKALDELEDNFEKLEGIFKK